MMPDRDNIAKSNESHTAGSPVGGEPVFIVVGKLRRPHGVHGEITVELLTDFPDRIRPRKTLYAGDEKTPLVVATARMSDKYLLVSFTGLQNLDLVTPLRNQFLFVKRDELPRLPEGQYYHHELIGCRVLSESGELMGILTEILQTGANDVYVVQPEEGEEILLPAIPAVILDVDIARKEVRARPLEWG